VITVVADIGLLNIHTLTKEPVLGTVAWRVLGKRNTYRHIINQDDIARNHPAHWLDNSYLLVAVNLELITAHCHGRALIKTLKETRKHNPIEHPALIRIESYEHTCLKLAGIQYNFIDIE
jgi:hypothetical protein